MDIVRTQREDHLELVIEGRLDGYWAQHLSTSVGDVMREGSHSVRLNLSRVSYISSAGIGTLVDLHKQFAAVGGAFAVTNPSRTVWKILEMVGLAAMLTGVAEKTAPAAGLGVLRIGGLGEFIASRFIVDARIIRRPHDRNDWRNRGCAIPVLAWTKHRCRHSFGGSRRR